LGFFQEYEERTYWTPDGVESYNAGKVKDVVEDSRLCFTQKQYQLSSSNCRCSGATLQPSRSLRLCFYCLKQVEVEVFSQEGSFLSQHVLFSTSTFAEMMMALSVLDLPLAARLFGFALSLSIKLTVCPSFQQRRGFNPFDAGLHVF